MNARSCVVFVLKILATMKVAMTRMNLNFGGLDLDFGLHLEMMIMMIFSIVELEWIGATAVC